MKLSGEYELPAGQEVVWRALNSEETLAQCIPGCSRFVRLPGDRFEMQITSRIGPVSAKFDGQVALTDILPPSSYCLSGSMSAGPMGFAKGTASVVLSPLADGTKLRYEVVADTGGKIAQIGSRVVDIASAKLAAEFFNRFAVLVKERHSVPSSVAAAEDTVTTDVPSGVKADSYRAWPRLVWQVGIGVLVALGVAYILLRNA